LPGKARLAGIRFSKSGASIACAPILSGAGTDHVTVLTTIAGHRTRDTARQRYHFALLILTALEAAAVWHKGRKLAM
jgi:hypothetical protein